MLDAWEAWCPLQLLLRGSLPCRRTHSGEAVCLRAAAQPDREPFLSPSWAALREGLAHSRKWWGLLPEPALARCLSCHMPPVSPGHSRSLLPYETFYGAPTACTVEESRHLCPTFQTCHSWLVLLQLPQPCLCSIHPRPLITTAKHREPRP